MAGRRGRPDRRSAAGSPGALRLASGPRRRRFGRDPSRHGHPGGLPVAPGVGFGEVRTEAVHGSASRPRARGFGRGFGGDPAALAGTVELPAPCARVRRPLPAPRRLDSPSGPVGAGSAPQAGIGPPPAGPSGPSRAGSASRGGGAGESRRDPGPVRGVPVRGSCSRFGGPLRIRGLPDRAAPGAGGRLEPLLARPAPPPRPRLPGGASVPAVPPARRFDTALVARPRPESPVRGRSPGEPDPLGDPPSVRKTPPRNPAAAPAASPAGVPSRST